MAGLEVQIGADKKDFDKKIKEVEFDIKELSKEKAIQIKLGLDTKEISGNIKEAKARLSELKTVAKDTGNAIGKEFTQKMGNGGNALMQFSRIAQDAPYGIIGIGNNITATVEAFGHLKNSTGSTGGALKALAGSIMGSGGILLGVSLLTSGLTYMAQNGLTVKDVFDKLTGAFDENAKAMQDINAESHKNASQQISTVGAYVSAAKNINLSMNDRLIAVKKLQDEYPAYFGNLTKEQILNGNVAGAVKEVTTALIQKAKAAALSGRLAELSEKEFLLREKEAKAVKKVKDAVKSLNQSNQQFQSGGGVMGATSQSGFGRLSAAQSAFQDIKTELREVLKTQQLYTSELNKSVAASIKLETVVDKTKTKKTKPTPERALPFTNSLSSGGELIDTNKIEYATGKLDEFGRKIKGLPGQITSDLSGMNNAIKAGFDQTILLAEEFNAQINDLITNSISGTFENLGAVIGDALSNGGNVLQAVGQTLIASLGAFLSDMGSLLIKYGTLAVVKGKLDLAILAGGPVSIAAGLAAIGVGILLKAAGGAIGNAAKSGGSASTGADYSSPASSSSSGGYSGGGGYGRVVFEISGQSLIGVLSNTLDKNKRLGGSVAI